MTAAAAMAAGGLVWRLIGWDDGQKHVATSPLAASSAGDDVEHRIVRWAPFQGASAPVGLDGLPATSLPLTLKGLVYASDQTRASVLLGAEDGTTQAYGVGASVAPGAVVERIEPDRVILRVEGRLEYLSFPDFGPAADPSQPLGAPSTGAPAYTPSAAPIVPTAPRAAPIVGVQTTAEGYLVGAEIPPQLARAGLRPGDLVRRLNGQALGDPANDQRLLEQAIASGSARLEIMRGAHDQSDGAAGLTTSCRLRPVTTTETPWGS